MAEHDQPGGSDVERAQRKATAAGVVGVLSLVCLFMAPACAGLTFPLGLVGSLLALGLGHVSRTELAMVGAVEGQKMARTGMICGYVGLGIVGLAVVVVVAVILVGGSLPAM